MPTDRPSIFDHVTAPAPRYLLRLALLEEIIASFPQPPRAFLEIGPGLGDVSAFLFKCFPQVMGDLLDFSADCRELLHDRLQNQRGLSVLHGDLLNYPFQKHYDLIIACEVFEHLPDDIPAFAKTYSLLNPGGYFVFSAPAFVRKWQQGDVYAGHYRRYERPELISKLESHGFTIDALWCYGFPITTFLYPLHQFYYRRKLRANSDTHETATKRSGIERPLTGLFRALRMDLLMRPFFPLQRLTRNMNLGDGFLALAHRPAQS